MRRQRVSKGISATIVSLFGRASRFAMTLSEAEWRQRLTPEQYRVMREHGTERSGSSGLDKCAAVGTYQCAACDQPLYSSDCKFDSCTGWPSFFAPIEDAVETSVDFHMIIPRTEVHCSHCGGHLGHAFGDGPQPTGQRHCINGIALKFTAR